jgi:NAD(P)-dependent dehydrogenase (short-subunit alcohol dehydrogenase family)
MAVFVVTGARRGIGLEYIRILSKEPSNTVVALVRDLNGDLSELHAIESKSNSCVHLVECDISSYDSISNVGTRLVSALGADFKISTLINNAAIQHSQQQTSLNMSAYSLQSHITTNVIGPARMVQVLLPYLEKGAVIANITSGIGSLKKVSVGRINAEITPYSINKTALNMLTVHQAHHLKGKAIVVCMDPGHVKTEMGGPKAVLETTDSAQSVLASVSRLVPDGNGKFFLYNGTELPW